MPEVVCFVLAACCTSGRASRPNRCSARVDTLFLSFNDRFEARGSVNLNICTVLVKGGEVKVAYYLLFRIHYLPLVALYYATICLERGPLLDRKAQWRTRGC
jgi:hypothetical protein